MTISLAFAKEMFTEFLIKEGIILGVYSAPDKKEFSTVLP